MSKKVLLMQGATRLTRDKWQKAATSLNVELVDCKATNHQEFLDYFKNDDIAVIANTVGGSAKMNGYSKELVDKLPSSIGAVCHEGAGYDAVGDAHWWHAKNVQVSNTPDAVITATADTALYLTLGAMRNFNGLAHSLRQGKWRGGLPLANEPDGKTLGILGLGGIGAVSRDKIVSALDFAKVQYHNRRRAPPDVEKGSHYVDFDTLLSTSDVILISVPLNKNTHHLIDKKALDKCKDGVTIINTARGAVIDEQALVDALESGKVKTVGLDVFEDEPEINPGLLKNENALLLPHAGTYTNESIVKMENQVLKNVESFLNDGKVVNLVAECQN